MKDDANSEHRTAPTDRPTGGILKFNKIDFAGNLHLLSVWKINVMCAAMWRTAQRRSSKPFHLPQASRDDSDRKHRVQDNPSRRTYTLYHTIRLLDRGHCLTPWIRCPTSCWHEETIRGNDTRGISRIRMFQLKGFNLFLTAQICAVYLVLFVVFHSFHRRDFLHVILPTDLQTRKINALKSYYSYCSRWI